MAQLERALTFFTTVSARVRSHTRVHAGGWPPLDSEHTRRAAQDSEHAEQRQGTWLQPAPAVCGVPMYAIDTAANDDTSVFWYGFFS